MSIKWYKALLESRNAPCVESRITEIVGLATLVTIIYQDKTCFSLFILFHLFRLLNALTN
jgi:hypothetical protein